MRRLRAGARRTGPGAGGAPARPPRGRDRIPGADLEHYGNPCGAERVTAAKGHWRCLIRTPRRSRGATPPPTASARRTTPDQLIAQIERTRESLAQTIDELTDRVSPSSNIRRLRERALAEAERPEVQLVIAAACLFVVGYVVFRALRRSR